MGLRDRQTHTPTQHLSTASRILQYTALIRSDPIRSGNGGATVTCLTLIASGDGTPVLQEYPLLRIGQDRSGTD
jgi:hypothetical protein